MDSLKKLPTKSGAWMLALILSGAGSLSAQTQTAELPSAPTPQVVTTKLPDGVVVEQSTQGALSLSLDQAIERGMKHNLQMLLSTQNERGVHGQVLTAAFDRTVK